MAYLEILQQHNADLGGLIDKANSLPEKGDVKGELNAFIEGTTTEVSSGATKVADYRFNQTSVITKANFPNAVSIGINSFYFCTSLTTIDLPSVTEIDDAAFANCSALTSVNAPNVTHISGYAFKQSGLSSIYFPKTTSVNVQAFYMCYSLAYAELPRVTRINAQGFGSCYSLKSVILRSETLCNLANKNAFTSCYHIHGTVNSTYNPNGDQDGYFYVPRSLVESYKVATNWSTFSTQFRALEDYTVDGTITGALDPNKI